MEPALARYAETRLAPECLVCGGTLRPQVVLFGEPLPASAWDRASGARADRGRLPVRRHLAAGLPGGRAGGGVRARAAAARDRLAAADRSCGTRPIPRLLRSAEQLLPAVASILRELSAL